MPHRTDDATLEAPHLPRPKRLSRIWRWIAPVAAIGLLTGWIAWYVTTPPALQTDDHTTTASAVVGQDLYIGMWAATDDFHRAIHISGVQVHATASQQLDMTPLLCHQGSIDVTSDPTQFCSSIDDPAGQRLGAGDSIILKLHGDSPVVANIDRIKVAFQEGLRWGTRPAGHAGAVVSFVDHAAP
jgi:hypothetical protein